MATAEDRFRQSIADKADPILKMLNRIGEMKDDTEFLATLQQFYKEMPMLTHLVKADVTRQRMALEAVITPDLTKGLLRK